MDFSAVRAIQADMDEKIEAIKPASIMDEGSGYEGVRASCDVRPRRVSGELFELFDKLTSGEGDRKELLGKIQVELLRGAK